MAELRAKHAFGKSENLQAAIQENKIDQFDILFLDGDTDPKIGWIDRDGNPVIVETTTELKGQVAGLETEIATKASSEEVAKLETELATKVSSEEVDAKIDDAVTEKVDAAVVQALAKTDKYEVLNVPKGTLVDYNDKEIRICCPANSEWAKQSVGEGGDANSYYMTFRTYAPNDDAVGYIEHLGDQVDPEILTDLRTDESGRRYQPTWLALAQYDAETDTWTYHGAKSTEGKYMGWNYQIDWFDADGIMIASDSIRINLSNEDCHSVIEPYYVGSAVAEKVDAKVEEVVETKVETIVETKVDTAIDEKVEGAVNTAKAYTDSKIAEIENSYGIIEF